MSMIITLEPINVILNVDLRKKEECDKNYLKMADIGMSLEWQYWKKNLKNCLVSESMKSSASYNNLFLHRGIRPLVTVVKFGKVIAETHPHRLTASLSINLSFA